MTTSQICVSNGQYNFNGLNFNMFIEHEIIQYRFQNHEKYDTFCLNSALTVCACMKLASKFKFAQSVG